MEVSFVSLLSCNQFGWWDEQEEQDTPPPTLPTLFLPHCVKSSTSLFLPHCVKSSAWVIICVFHAYLLQCWHTETLGVWLVFCWFFFFYKCPRKSWKKIPAYPRGLIKTSSSLILHPTPLAFYVMYLTLLDDVIKKTQDPWVLKNIITMKTEAV